MAEGWLLNLACLVNTFFAVLDLYQELTIMDLFVYDRAAW